MKDVIQFAIQQSSQFLHKALSLCGGTVLTADEREHVHKALEELEAVLSTLRRRK